MSKPFALMLTPARGFTVPVTVTEKSDTVILLPALRIAELVPHDPLACASRHDIIAELASRLSPVPVATTASATERRAA